MTICSFLPLDTESYFEEWCWFSKKRQEGLRIAFSSHWLLPSDCTLLYSLNQMENGALMEAQALGVEKGNTRGVGKISRVHIRSSGLEECWKHLEKKKRHLSPSLLPRAMLGEIRTPLHFSPVVTPRRLMTETKIEIGRGTLLSLSEQRMR